MQQTHTMPAIDALKLCVEALTARYMRSGINMQETEALNVAKYSIKAQIGEWYADGRWQSVR
jgi:hypothetical protein